jgi:hypothetical protein
MPVIIYGWESAVVPNRTVFIENWSISNSRIAFSTRVYLDSRNKYHFPFLWDPFVVVDSNRLELIICMGIIKKRKEKKRKKKTVISVNASSRRESSGIGSSILHKFDDISSISRDTKACIHVCDSDNIFVHKLFIQFMWFDYPRKNYAFRCTKKKSTHLNVQLPQLIKN